eukprot:1239255-Pyramimonas_sp.AAC.1
MAQQEEGDHADAVLPVLQPPHAGAVLPVLQPPRALQSHQFLQAVADEALLDDHENVYGAPINYGTVCRVMASVRKVCLKELKSKGVVILPGIVRLSAKVKPATPGKIVNIGNKVIRASSMPKHLLVKTFCHKELKRIAVSDEQAEEAAAAAEAEAEAEAQGPEDAADDGDGVSDNSCQQSEDTD